MTTIAEMRRSGEANTVLVGRVAALEDDLLFPNRPRYSTAD